MLELNPAPSSDNFIVEGSDASFMADVIEASQKIPVIVDFWANWCEPCKSLGPTLEAEVNAAKGKVKLVKIDIDKNPAVAGQLRVQSIPMVYAFHAGQPVDGFQGNVAASEIKAFIARLLKLGGQGEESGIDDALAAGEEMLATGAYIQAIETFGAILGQVPENAAAYSGLIRAYLGANDIPHAEGLLTNAPEAIAASPEIEAARAQLELLKQAENAGPLESLRESLDKAPNDEKARFDYATALYTSGQIEAAIDELLEVFRQNREWNDEAAKKQLFKIFDTLKPQDPLLLNGRRKLTSLIFS